MEDVKIEVEPGDIVVNAAYLYAGAPNIACVCVDLQSKYAEISMNSSGDGVAPAIYLEAGENTKHYDIDLLNNLTRIAFPDYVGWSVFTGMVARYTAMVTLVKQE